ncbi:cathepsin L-like [Drosophila sulfurigaster albostrigata]|uniref:cathepsin L-like n=1 Tax=Drosophila sulfurigaster albostrigata TaxID=89887 RepID=UPI002D21EA9C|nr:cathepsin L-like [Drosophila sulfurigaster albostrigata]
MKTIILFVALVGYAQALSYSDVLEEEWNRFQLDYTKFYQTEDEALLRRLIFEDNKRMIDNHNRRFMAGLESYEMGVNQFTDLLPKEFQSLMLSSLNITEAEGLIDFRYSAPRDVDPPSSIDWRTKGAVTPVKNQGDCGSCWAFATTGTLEGQTFVKTGRLVSLSEQNLVDCSNDPPYNNGGCDGGLTLSSLKYIMDNGGIDTESSYPYKGIKQACQYNGRNIGATVQGFVMVNDKSEKYVAAATAFYGPVSVGVDSRGMQSYKGGVYNNLKCSETKLDHAMVVVGYGNDKSGGDYWLVKNSWGTTWGENGYIRMSRNRNNQCGIATIAVFPIV